MNSTWETLLETWLTANYIKGGPTGYDAGLDLQNIKAHTMPDGIMELLLTSPFLRKAP